jgi:hypothetical protein
VSTTSIIALSAIIMLFIVLMIGASIAIIYLLLKLHRHISSTTITIRDLLAEASDSNLSHREALISSLSSHSSTLQLIEKSISSTLDSHYAKLQIQIQQINGQAIVQAVEQFTELVRQQAQTATRTERAAIAIGELCKALISEEAFSGSAIDRAKSSGLGPDSYAPNPTGERYTGQSRTAAGDVQDLAEEAQDNSFLDQ